MKALPNKQSKLDYMWVIAGLCFLVMFVGLGFCSTAKNAYFQPIVEALDFSRSAFGISDTFRYATTSVATLFLYRFVERFGTKKILCAGLVCYTLSALINSLSNTLVGFYLGGIFLGLAVTLAGSTMASIIINKWFTKNKGTVLGIILAANAAGSALAIALLEPMIYSDGVGYKNAYFITSLAVVCVLITVLLFFKDKPKVQQELTLKKEEKASGEWEGFSYSWLKRKPIFYAIIIFVAFYALSSVNSISTPHLKDVGFSGKFIALNACVGSIVLMVSKILVGIIYDRFGIKIAVNLCLFSALASKIILFFVTSQTTALALLYTVLISIATPFETVMIPIIVLDLFGQKSFTKTLTVTTSLFTVGQALNSPLLNMPYDLSGSYMISFVTSTVASVAIIFVLNYSMLALKKKQKQEGLSRE